MIEGGAIFYVRADHVGRPVFATNATGAKVWTMSFDTFGNLIASTGNPIAARFPGQWFQAESGLHQNWMRDYDPTTGRYIQPDPLGLIDGSSIYGYAWQNPGRWTDPRGERTLILQHYGLIFDKDWYADPTLPQKIGRRWKHRCSSANLVFHNPDKYNPRPHWHYYPNGNNSGPRNAARERWSNPEDGDTHLYPPFLLEVEDCPCDGSEVDPWTVIGFALLGAAALGTGAGQTAAIGALLGGALAR